MKIRLLFFFFVLMPLSTMAAESPLMFSETVQFVSKSEKPLLDLTKAPEFIGLLLRRDAPADMDDYLDLYQFNRIEKPDLVSCKKIASEVFGDFNNIALKFLSAKIFQSKENMTICEAIIQDPDEDALFKERRLYSFVRHGKTFAMVYRSAKPLDEGDAESLRGFVKGIR